MMTQAQCTARARRYSKRHSCTVEVQHQIKGRGRGSYYDHIPGDASPLWPGVVEIIAVYQNGVRQDKPVTRRKIA